MSATGNATTAKTLVDAGIDRIVAYHSSVYRMRGIPSIAGLLPWASANEQTLNILPNVLAGVETRSVLATVSATDPFLTREMMLNEIEKQRAVGVLNAPTVGLFTGAVREVLEAEDLGKSAEIELINEASARGLEAWAYVFDGDWAHDAIEANATGLIVHLGLTGHGDAEQELEVLRGCLNSVANSGANIPVLVHGGSLTDPQKLEALFGGLPNEFRNMISGFMGASVFEKSPDVLAAANDWRTAINEAINN